MTPTDSVFRFDDSGVRNLLTAFESPHFVRVGVFGGSGGTRKAAGEKSKGGEQGVFQAGRKKGRRKADVTNAEVGFKCEFGEPPLNGRPGSPPRPWLRMPLMTKIEAIVADTAKAFEGAVRTGDPVPFLTLLGVNAEKQIQLAFDSGGFGSWPKNTPYTVAQKGSDAPNIDTAQLRRAVTSMVL